ncbi:serine protease, partial [bacterium]|nr:serine protease [bacterium]
TYITKVPFLDGWEVPMSYRVNAKGTAYRMVSAGADRVFEPSITEPGNLIVTIETTEPSKDIVYENGQFIQYPKEIQRILATGDSPPRAQESSTASRVFAGTSKSVLLLIVKSPDGVVLGQGTGFVVTGGRIVTNEHVVRAGDVFIDLGPVKLPLKVERTDPLNDLALLTAAAELEMAPLPFAGAAPATGTTIYAIGNPAGLERSISAGIVSGVRNFRGRQLLQISAPISPGSSGGPILNDSGEVVGVAVGILEKGQNLNFAVPAALVRGLLRGERTPGVDTDAVLEEVAALRREQLKGDFSSEPASTWQQLQGRINKALHEALLTAGGSADDLIKVSGAALFIDETLAIM